MLVAELAMVKKIFFNDSLIAVNFRIEREVSKDISKSGLSIACRSALEL